VEFIFWAAVLLLLHTYLLYPLSLFVWDGAREVMGTFRFFRGEQAGLARPHPTLAPTVTLVVPAHNEESCILEKLSNCLSLDYPEDKLEVLVGNDGSTDATERLIASCSDERIKLSSAPRGGKVAVLNRCIEAARGEIVVLTDANTVVHRSALRALVRHFAAPEVGAVCGRLRLVNPSRKEYEESLYWAYESLIKFYEGKHGAVLGANGGLYAIRRSLFERLPKDTIVDDFVIPLRILSKGFRVLYDPEAVAEEETTENYGLEFGRRARIAAGDFQSIKLLKGILSPRRGFAAYAFWSHKLLRWAAPLLMTAAFAANFALLRFRIYQMLLVAQLAFYLLAWAGSRVPMQGRLKRLASTVRYFVVMNLAFVVGFWRFVRKTQAAAWTRTVRPAERAF
jgi:cellulose synthase/poly-beta-1,6-N-acetylglucosamine synthase-like glycosyltransferase